jgi:hypothetical protein
LPGKSNKKEAAMSYVMTVKKAKELEAESYVLAPQHPTGLLLVHTIAELEVIEGGKWIQVTTEDDRKHLLSPDDRVFVMF